MRPNFPITIEEHDQCRDLWERFFSNEKYEREKRVVTQVELSKGFSTKTDVVS